MATCHAEVGHQNGQLNGHSARIILVQDDAAAREGLRSALASEGYECVATAGGDAAVTSTVQHEPDLVVLDVGRNGAVQPTRKLREWTQAPIVVIGENADEDNKVSALDAGADDYVTRPFGSRELLARVRAILRRMPRSTNGSAGPILRVGPIVLDLDLRRLVVSGREVSLTPKELSLMTTFMRNAGRVMSSERLFDEAWGQDPGSGRSQRARAQLIRVYVLQLRQKIEADPSSPRLLVTETGVGYRLRAPAAE
jgi:two-component system KDP operon response regulator KdpE